MSSVFSADNVPGLGNIEVTYLTNTVDNSTFKASKSYKIETIDQAAGPDSLVGKFLTALTGANLLAPPDAENPIVQSYVDIFITGCLELQARVADPDLDFVAQCVRTTDGWSKHWVNDRLQPRRPYIHQPRAWEIDQHMKRLLPEFVGTIRIE